MSWQQRKAGTAIAWEGSHCSPTDLNYLPARGQSDPTHLFGILRYLKAGNLSKETMTKRFCCMRCVVLLKLKKKAKKKSKN